MRLITGELSQTTIAGVFSSTLRDYPFRAGATNHILMEARSGTSENSTRRNKMKAPFLIGRLLFAGLFINSGISHLQKHREMSDYARSKGVPKPELAVTLSAIPLLVGGVSLALGVKPKLGAIALIGFLAGVTPIMHDFWRNEDPEERKSNMVEFMKNLALAGGTLALSGVDEPWEASIPTAKPRLAQRIREVGRKIAA